MNRGQSYQEQEKRVVNEKEEEKQQQEERPRDMRRVHKYIIFYLLVQIS
jgi:hypothetical protein